MKWMSTTEADQLLAGLKNGFLVFRDRQQALESEFWESCQRKNRPAILVRMDATLPPADRSHSTLTRAAVSVSVDCVTTTGLHLSERQQEEFRLMAGRFGANTCQISDTFCSVFVQDERAAEQMAQLLSRMIEPFAQGTK